MAYLLTPYMLFKGKTKRKKIVSSTTLSLITVRNDRIHEFPIRKAFGISQVKYESLWREQVAFDL